MGRELKRVPLDFNWPINQIWKGFINPHYKKCPNCENGFTSARVRLQDLVSLILLSGSDSLEGKNHPYFDWITKRVHGFNSVPSKDMAELTGRLAGRSPERPFGHDSSDCWTAEKKIILAAGLTEDWGICPTCAGEAIDPTIKEAYESWVNYEPPAGYGFQLWTTTTEGSPIIPVFATLDELCAYAEDNCTTFGYNKTSKENWKQMLDDGFVAHQEGNMIFV